MTRLPTVNARQLLRVLSRLEFSKTHQKGSHAFYAHADGRATVVPLHRGEDIGRGLLRAILRDIEKTPAEFVKLLKS